MSSEINRLLALLPPVFANSPGQHELPILKTGKVACAFALAAKDIRSAWGAAAKLHPQTGMWPVAMSSSARGGIAAADIFSRNYFREEMMRGEVTPEAILKRAAILDVDKFLARRAARLVEDYDIGECLDDELDAMRFAVNKAPKRVEVDAAIKSKKIRGPHELDRWLLDWELANKVKRNPQEGRHEPLAPDPAWLVLMPVENSWDVLAYIHWFGCIHFNSEDLVALGRRWQKQFGAEVYAIYGNTLECRVARPPATVNAAWPLAREHELVSPSANAASGTALRQYALSLVNHPHWSFHER